jgi:hypothetical protein
MITGAYSQFFQCKFQGHCTCTSEPCAKNFHILLFKNNPFQIYPSSFLQTKNLAFGRVFTLDYLDTITANRLSINFHFVEVPVIEALIEHKT